MKKLWSSPEVFAAVITIVGTLLVSVLLGFVEGRIGFGSVLALFAIFAVGTLIYALHKRGGTKMAVGGGIAMVLIGFLVFFGYRLLQGGLTFGGGAATPPIATTENVDTAPATPAETEASQATDAPTAPATPEATTAAPQATAPATATGPIVGIWETLDTLPQKVLTFCALPDALYAGAEGMIYRSDDAGATWAAVSGSIPNVRVIALACAPGSQQRVYAALGSRNAFLYSDDGGVTWQEQSKPDFTLGGFDFALLAAPSQPETLYFLSEGYWLMMSPNAGRTWIPAGAGLPQSDRGDTSVLSLAIHPANANTLYAGTGSFVHGGRGVYKSTDGGQSWTPVNSGMLDLRITAVAIDPVNPETVYAGSDSGDVLKSSDGGVLWTRLDLSSAMLGYSKPREIRVVVVDPGDPNLVLILGDNSGPLASRDGGQTWQMLGKPSERDQPYFSASLIAPGPPITILVDFESYEPQRYIETP